MRWHDWREHIETSATRLAADYPADNEPDGTRMLAFFRTKLDSLHAARLPYHLAMGLLRHEQRRHDKD